MQSITLWRHPEYALSISRYAASGSDAWDATIDVHQRPRWLKELAGIAPDTAESPAANALFVEAADLRRPFRPIVTSNPLHTDDLNEIRLTEGSGSGSGGERSKVHPSDKYVTQEDQPDTTLDIEASSAAPLVDISLDVSRAPSAMADDPGLGNVEHNFLPTMTTTASDFHTAGDDGSVVVQDVGHEF